MLRHLHEFLGFKSFHLRWVPHELTNDLRQKQKEHASATVPFFYSAQRDGSHDLVSDHESWFLFDLS
jgi:hypothetical protein